MKALIVALVLALCAAGAQTLRLAKAERQWAQERQQLAEAAARAEQQARTEERRRALVAQEVADAGHITANRRTADRRAADAAGDGLRLASESLVRFAAERAGAACECEATTRALRVQSIVLAEMEREGRRMAEIADQRGDAGQACERFADGLR